MNLVPGFGLTPQALNSALVALAPKGWAALRRIIERSSMESSVVEKQKPALWAGSLNSGAGLAPVIYINIIIILIFFHLNLFYTNEYTIILLYFILKNQLKTISCCHYLLTMWLSMIFIWQHHVDIIFCYFFNLKQFVMKWKCCLFIVSGSFQGIIMKGIYRLKH